MFVHSPDGSSPPEENGGSGFDLAGPDGSKTPHTPELLNSLMSLVQPPLPASFAQYQSAGSASCCGAPPAAGTPSTPSVQQTASSLIREGLKHTIKSRRASSGQTLQLDEKPVIKEELTCVDEERRRRRRERNKVAATKCRNKKKAETQHLIQDSELQVNQHNSLRLEILQLLEERSQLMTLLSSHLPACGTSSCADSTAAALSKCSHTPPPEVPRPLSPLTPLTSPSGERRPSGSSTCSWGSLSDLPAEPAGCALPYPAGGGFPCGGSVITNPALTPSPTSSVSPGGNGGLCATISQGYGPMYSGVSPHHSGGGVLMSPRCSSVSPCGGSGAQMPSPHLPLASPAGPSAASAGAGEMGLKLRVRSPSGCPTGLSYPCQYSPGQMMPPPQQQQQSPMHEYQQYCQQQQFQQQQQQQQSPSYQQQSPNYQQQSPSYQQQSPGYPQQQQQQQSPGYPQQQASPSSFQYRMLQQQQTAASALQCQPVQACPTSAAQMQACLGSSGGQMQGCAVTSAQMQGCAVTSAQMQQQGLESGALMMNCVSQLNCTYPEQFNRMC